MLAVRDTHLGRREPSASNAVQVQADVHLARLGQQTHDGRGQAFGGSGVLVGALGQGLEGEHDHVAELKVVDVGGHGEGPLQQGHGRGAGRAGKDAQRIAIGVLLAKGLVVEQIGQPGDLLLRRLALGGRRVVVVVVSKVGVVEVDGGRQGVQEGEGARGIEQLPLARQQRAQGVDVARHCGDPQRHGGPAVDALLVGGVAEAGGGNLELDRVGREALGGGEVGGGKVVLVGGGVGQLGQVDGQGGLAEGGAVGAVELPQAHDAGARDGDEAAAVVAQRVPQHRGDGRLFEHMHRGPDLERPRLERGGIFVGGGMGEQGGLGHVDYVHRVRGGDAEVVAVGRHGEARDGQRDGDAEDAVGGRVAVLDARQVGPAQLRANGYEDLGAAGGNGLARAVVVALLWVMVVLLRVMVVALLRAARRKQLVAGAGPAEPVGRVAQHGGHAGESGLGGVVKVRKVVVVGGGMLW